MPVSSGESVLTCTVKDLYVNCEYYFRVKAINQVGAGQYLELRQPVITEDVKRRFTAQGLQRHNQLCHWEHVSNLILACITL